jgi:hypothetical protein
MRSLLARGQTAKHRAFKRQWYVYRNWHIRMLKTQKVPAHEGVQVAAGLMNALRWAQPRSVDQRVVCVFCVVNLNRDGRQMDTQRARQSSGGRPVLHYNILLLPCMLLSCVLQGV